jgi:anti-anti-sigma regulatory factor
MPVVFDVRRSADVGSAGAPARISSARASSRHRCDADAADDTGGTKKGTVMTVATVETGAISCTRLADGIVVQLSGAIGDEQTGALRNVLLRPAPVEIRDVVVDAGDVYAVSSSALAVLVAANEWAATGGRRFMLSRSCAALDEALRECGVEGGLPRLNALGGGDADETGVVIPIPRATVD